MASGKLTTQVAHKLVQQLPPHYHVLYGHGQKGSDPPEQLGEIVSWYGDKFSNAARLAFLDIAVVSPNSDRVLALVEVEETTSVPKTVLGDVFAALLGHRLTFQGKRDLAVGGWTTLIVLVRSKPGGQGQIAFLAEQVDRIRPHLTTPHASIGRIVVDTFTDEDDLASTLQGYVEEALRHS